MVLFLLLAGVNILAYFRENVLEFEEKVSGAIILACAQLELQRETRNFISNGIFALSHTRAPRRHA